MSEQANRKGFPWSKEEKELLQILWPDLSITRHDIQVRLGRTFNSVYQQAKVLGIRRNQNTPEVYSGPPWSEEEDTFLRRVYPTDVPLEEIKKAFPLRSMNGIQTRANILNLKRGRNRKNRLNKEIIQNLEKVYGI